MDAREEGGEGPPAADTGAPTPASRPSAVPPAPPPPPGRGPAGFTGAFAGPLQPPPPPDPTGGLSRAYPGAYAGYPGALPGPFEPLPPVTDEVLAIPLGTGALVRQALDLLTRRDAGLRGASFYIGFMFLVTVTPMVILFGLMLTLPQFTNPYGASDAAMQRSLGFLGWLVVSLVPAGLGWLAGGTEARSMATAVLGGRVEGRPLRLRESIAVARRRFWSVLGAQLLIGVIAWVVSTLTQLIVVGLVGPVEALTFGISLVVSVVIGAPFVYVPAGIILGEVGVGEAIVRSFRLVRLRVRLAIVVTIFGVLSQFIVLFGLSIGLDVVARVFVGAGLTQDFPRPLVVPLAAILVFALGTLTFLVEAIAAAPAVHAFEALTHYTHGLEAGRRAPIPGRRIWNPWVTRGLAATAALGLLALVGGILSLPA